MQVVDPSVSIDSMFLTSTFLSAILFAVNAKHTVTVNSNPSGTLATMIPIMKITFVIKSYPMINPKIKNKIPITIEIKEISLMNFSISIAKVV